MKKPIKNELPQEWVDLINQIRMNSPDSGGANRGAVAEMQARAAVELNKATNGLRTATWILAFSTLALCLITILKG
jgi:hypothetical protein